MQIAQTRNVRVLSAHDMGVDEMQAYEIVADADETKSGKPIRLYQVIAPEGRGYFIFQGLVGLDGAPDYLAEFRRVTDFFKRHTRQPPRGSPPPGARTAGGIRLYCPG